MNEKALSSAIDDVSGRIRELEEEADQAREVVEAAVEYVTLLNMSHHGPVKSETKQKALKYLMDTIDEYLEWEMGL